LDTTKGAIRGSLGSTRSNIVAFVVASIVTSASFKTITTLLSVRNSGAGESKSAPNLSTAFYFMRGSDQASYWRKEIYVI
jgi:hypothetical protein